MPQINDGGNFSPDVYARLMALKNGSASEDELAQNEQTSQDAAQAGQNAAMGTMGGPQGSALKALAEGTVPAVGENMANDIRQAAQNSSVKVIPSAADTEAANFAQQAQGQPSYWDTIKAKATQNGVGADPATQEAFARQAADTQARLAARNANQLQQAKFNGIQKYIKGGQ